MVARWSRLARLIGSLGLADLEQDVDERAALEVIALEPPVEYVEDREQPCGRVLGALLDFMLEPVLGPELVAAFEECEDECVLGGEVTVERHASDAGPFDDRVDADGADALPGEELVRGVEDPLACTHPLLVRGGGHRGGR